MNAPIVATGTYPGLSIAIVNPNDRDWTRHRYVLAFGAYGWTRLLIWANSLDDALEEAGDWIEDHAPGLFCDEAVADAYAEARERGLSEEDAQAEAEQDTTSVCSGNHYLPSWEWSIVAEDPSRADIKAMLAGG